MAFADLSRSGLDMLATGDTLMPDRIDHLFAESDARMNALLAVHASRMERMFAVAEREFRP